MIGAVAITYFLYNAGYWLPFGGGSPGPRFLIPALPFLAIGLGVRLPAPAGALTLALAIPSVTFMVAGALTYPLIGDNGTGIWANQLGERNAGAHPADGARGPKRLAGGRPGARRGGHGDRLRGAGDAAHPPRGHPARRSPRVLGWAVVSIAGPTVAGDPVTPLDDGPAALSLIAVGVVASLTALLALRYRERRAEPAPDGLAVQTPTPCRPIPGLRAGHGGRGGGGRRQWSS